MEQQIPSEKENNQHNLVFPPIRLKETLNQIGSEKIRVFKLLLRLKNKAFYFENYLDATMKLLSCTNKSFIETRSDELLVWLLEKLSYAQEITSFKGDCSLSTLRHTITFPFRTKEVLSLFIDLKDSSVDINSIKRIVLENYKDIALVNGSFLSIIDQQENTAKIHLEVQKEKAFSEKEVSSFQKNLPQIIEDYLGRPKVQLIVPSNRELLLKSFRWIISDLNREDIPQIFIDFSRQTESSFQFSTLICAPREFNEIHLKEKLNHPDIHVEASNNLKEENYLKDGVVLTIEISTKSALSIIEARKKAYLLIESLLGPIRDVNGGLLEKIENNFCLLCNEIKAPIESLENFFYGIYPQERQATASISLLKKVYTSMNRPKLDQEIDYFVKEDDDSLCITIRTSNSDFEKEFRHPILSKFPELLIASSHSSGRATISCAFQKTQELESELLKSLTFSFYNHWKEKKELKQVLRLGCTIQFPSLDPRIGVEEEPSSLLKMLFEGLIKIGANGKPENALAKKIEISKSGLLYRFHLRESYWSNKMPLTAHDFSYSWETSLKPDFSSPLSYLFYPIENAKAVKEGKLPSSQLGIKVIDDLTLEIKLQYPCPYFLELCAHSAFAPICKSVDIHSPSWPKSIGLDYPCNGPFTLEMINNKEIVLKKNHLLWEKEKVKLEKIVVSNMTEDETSSFFQKKKLDALLYPFCKKQPLSLLNSSKNQKKKCITETRYLSFDCKKVPFSNKKMRWAFSLAIQRKILAPAFSCNSQPYYAPYSPEFSQLDLKNDKEENLTLAKNLFFEALEEMGLKPSIFDQEKIYATVHSQGLETLIAKQLNDLFGINIKPTIVEPSKYFSMIRERKVNIYIYMWVNRIQDPSYFLESFSSLGNIINYTNWNSKKINNLSQLIQNTSCLKNREKLHYQAEGILYNEKPIIPILTTSAYSLTHSDVFDINVGNSQPFNIRCCYKK